MASCQLARTAATGTVIAEARYAWISSGGANPAPNEIDSLFPFFTGYSAYANQVWDSALASLVASGIKMDLATTTHIEPVGTKAWSVATATAAAACTKSCTLSCEVSCTHLCIAGENAERHCNKACQNGCTLACEHSCQATCEVKCEGWTQ